METHLMASFQTRSEVDEVEQPDAAVAVDVQDL
jgi:hypothetical protein